LDRNLALEFVRATEAAALAAARWMGKGNTEAADRDAAAALHRALNSIHFRGNIALGEGDREECHMLYTGQPVGLAETDEVDLAVDALECTRSVAFGRTNALAIVAVAPKDGFFLAGTHYMEKIAVGPEAAAVIDLNDSVEANLHRIAEAKEYSINDLTVVLLERERHAELIARVRRTGARIQLIPDGDVAAAIATAIPGSGIDVLVGTGSAAAGTLAAAALRCLGGEILGRPAPANQAASPDVKEVDPPAGRRIYRCRDLARGEDTMFVATGVTDGDILNGVRYRKDGATTHSLVLRAASRTRRFMVTEHYFDENPVY
jgi:fructose-1,6-bisphosphatase II